MDLQELIDMGNVAEAIKYAYSKRASYPTKPTKPFLKADHTSDDIVHYSYLFKSYEDAMVIYNKEMEAYRKSSGKIEKIIEDLIKTESGLNTVVPEQYRSKVYSYAYDKGHSDGVYEVYLILCNLVSIFE